jgi:sulfoxide reductase heme-binding subunit YedZ
MARHSWVAALAGFLVWMFWLSRSNWDPEMPLWKAVGDAAYVLLLVALTLGPISKLIPSTRSWIRWRRQFGIWFAMTAAIHEILITNGWAEWSPRRFLGYEFVPPPAREARM